MLLLKTLEYSGSLFTLDPDGYMATGDNFVTSVHMRTGRKLMKIIRILDIKILFDEIDKSGFDEGA